MLCRVNLSLGVDWLKSELTGIEYENYEKMDCTVQFYSKFHNIKTMNDASNQTFEKNTAIYILKHVRM